MLHANAFPGKNVDSSPLSTPETRHCPAGYADHWTTISFPPPMGFSAHAWGVIGRFPSIRAAIIDRNSQTLTQWAVRSLASVAQALVYHSTGALSQGDTDGPGAPGSSADRWPAWCRDGHRADAVNLAPRGTEGWGRYSAKRQPSFVGGARRGACCDHRGPRSCPGWRYRRAHTEAMRCTRGTATEKAAALPFRVDRLSRRGEPRAGGCKPPPKALRKRCPFLRLCQQTRQECLPARRFLGWCQLPHHRSCTHDRSPADTWSAPSLRVTTC